MASGDAIDQVFKQLGNEPTHPIITPIENALNSIGLMQGPLSPALRAGFGFGVGYVLMEAVRPGFAYDGNNKRPWAYSSNTPEATAVPWWMPPAAIGVFLSVFI